MDKMRYKMRLGEKERRKTERIKTPLKIRYKRLSERGLHEESLTQDISGGGMRLKVTNSFKIGERLKTRLYFPDNARPVNIISRVVWRKRRKDSGNAQYDVGIEHVRIEPKHREKFVLLFCETMVNYLTGIKRLGRI